MVRNPRDGLLIFLLYVPYCSAKAILPGAQFQLCLQYGHAVKVS